MAFHLLPRKIFWRISYAADSNRAANLGTGDFGTSPVFVQLSDKPLLASIWVCGVRELKAQWRIRKIPRHRPMMPALATDICLEATSASKSAAPLKGLTRQFSCPILRLRDGPRLRTEKGAIFESGDTLFRAVRPESLKLIGWFRPCSGCASRARGN